MNSTRVHIEDADGNKKIVFAYNMSTIMHIIREQSKMFNHLDNQNESLIYVHNGIYSYYDHSDETIIELTKEEYESIKQELTT